MDIDVKKLARQQYFKYFRIWFIVLGIMLAISAVLLVGSLLKTDKKNERNNTKAPEERVYDYANVLSSSEEDKLRELIAKAEAEIQCDLVLVTINQPVENLTDEEMEEYGYRYNNWDDNMMDYADDFYDYNDYGYNEVGGDGALLLDNWYKAGTDESQAGSWLSTCGEVYEQFGMSEINYVLDEVYYALDDGAYEGYKAYIDEMVRLMRRENSDLVVYGSDSGYLIGAIIIPIIVAVVFVVMNLKSKEGKVTTTASTYVDNGKAKVNVAQDRFIRKSVSTRVIQSSSSGSRSSGGGGRGGSHRSSSGRSHGGGGRRR